MKIKSHQKVLVILMLLGSFVWFNLSAQNQKIDVLKALYAKEDNEVLVEGIFLHLPKLIYRSNEYLWLAGYVYDVNYNIPMIETTNVFCGIYDSTGKQILKEIFYAENGKFHGQLKLPENLEKGKYFVKAYTNYMKNFNKQNSFLQDFYVVDGSFEDVYQEETGKFQIEVYPEGGTLIQDVANTVTVSIELGEEIVSIAKCDIINQKDEIIVGSINLNNKGIGRFNFTPKSDENYILRLITADGNHVSKELPKAEQSGFTVSINNLIQDKVLVNFKTNKSSLKNLNQSSFFLAIHNNHLHEVIEFECDKIENVIAISRENLLDGINHFTFYDNELNEVTSRIIFNEKKILKTNTEIEILKVKNDSVTVKLKPALVQSVNPESYLSIAVLPKESTSALTNPSIANWVKVKPVLGDKNSVQIQRFVSDPKRAQYTLDLFLSGTESTDVNSANIDSFKPTYEFENGFKIEGRIQIEQTYSDKKLFVFQDKVGNFLTTTIGNTNTFSFERAFLVADDDLNISIEEKDNLDVKNIELSIYPQLVEESLSQEEIKKHTSFSNKDLEQTFDVVLDSLPPSLLSTTNVLKEVVLTAKKKNEMTRNSSLSDSFFETRKITTEERKRWPRLSTYVRRLGFRVYTNLSENTFVILGKSYMNKQLPIVYIDGLRLKEPLKDYTLNMIDEIYYEHSGLEGSDGGTIYIYTRFDFSDNKNAVAKLPVETGYTVPLPFEQASYDTYSLKDFLSYGLIYWEGNASLDEDESLTISFPMFNLATFLIQINGFTEDGELISIHEVIEVENN